MTGTIAATVDLREPEGMWDAVEAHPDVGEVTVDRLEAADVLIKDAGFERKTPSDFAASMTDRDDHLKQQVLKMQADRSITHPYIVIEGDLREFQRLPHTQVSATSLRGFAASIVARDNIPIMFCSDRENLVDLCVRLARKHTEPASSASLRVNSAVDHEAPFEKRVYGCIEGVGPAMADALYDQFPTLVDALSAQHGDLTAIDGIGDTLAERILATLYSERPTGVES